MSSASFRVEVSQADADAFARVSGDWNPLHTDEDHASRTTYGRCVLHGAFSAGLVSRLAGMYLPGADCLLHGMRLRFVTPIVVPAALLVSGRVTSESAGQGRVDASVVDAESGAAYVEASYEFGRYQLTGRADRRSEAPAPEACAETAPILVTGATGGLGSAVLRCLGDAAQGVSRGRNPGMLGAPRPDALREALGERRIGGIVHCGWPAPDNERLVNLADVEKAVDHNLGGPVREIVTLAQLLIAHGTKNAILVLVGFDRGEPRTAQLPDAAVRSGQDPRPRDGSHPGRRARLGRHALRGGGVRRHRRRDEPADESEGPPRPRRPGPQWPARHAGRGGPADRLAAREPELPGLWRHDHAHRRRPAMNFLEAHKAVAGFAGGEPLPFVLAMSGTAEPLELYLRAAAAKRGRSAVARTLPFNTLAQRLATPAAPGEPEVFVLLPWDFVPEADWRSGLPPVALDAGALRERAQATAAQLKPRADARYLYLPAAIPPLFSEPGETGSLAHGLTSLACSLGAQVLPAEAFALGTYLSTGCPIAGAWLGRVAEAVVEALTAHTRDSRKVLVTDLDNVLWAGVVADDGADGIHHAPEGVGYRHFLYQSLLAKLEGEGVLLAAVSRNDPGVAGEPLRDGRMLLKEADFVCVLASYNAKSAQIREIARQLNLGVDSFVFVDDNPVELAEVAAELPGVACLQFPSKDDGLPELFRDLARLFAKPFVTVEDRERTQLYRRRLDGIAASEARGGDLTTFLRDLGMILSVHDRTRGDWKRALQLINKTNQFNLNGRRLTEQELGDVLASGGSLYGASLDDRTGSHGEILACLISGDGTVRAFVMSCRVFERRVEYAFMAWLANRRDAPRRLEFAATPRNEPIRRFLQDAAFTTRDDGVVGFDAAQFAVSHTDDFGLFTIRGPEGNDGPAHPERDPSSRRAGRAAH